MSTLCQKRTRDRLKEPPLYPLKADIATQPGNLRVVPATSWERFNRFTAQRPIADHDRRNDLRAGDADVH
jgi:hypothetical protein